MIKPLNSLQLSAAKPRSGLQSIGDLLPRLIRQYELQAELARKEEAIRNGDFVETEFNTGFGVELETETVATQATFGWYE